MNGEQLAASRSSCFGNGNFSPAAEICACYGSFAVHNVLHCACADYLAAVNACIWAYVNDEIRRSHGILVMLNYDKCVAQITQTLQRCDKLVIIPLMKTDRRLIKDIKHAHQ